MVPLKCDSKNVLKCGPNLKLVAYTYSKHNVLLAFDSEDKHTTPSYFKDQHIFKCLRIGTLKKTLEEIIPR